MKINVAPVTCPTCGGFGTAVISDGAPLVCGQCGGSVEYTPPVGMPIHRYVQLVPVLPRPPLTPDYRDAT